VEAFITDTMNPFAQHSTSHTLDPFSCSLFLSLPLIPSIDALCIKDAGLAFQKLSNKHI